MYNASKSNHYQKIYSKCIKVFFLLSLFCTETLRETPSTTTDQNYFYNFSPHFADKTAKLRTIKNGLTRSVLKRAISHGENNEFYSAIQDTELKGLAKLHA